MTSTEEFPGGYPPTPQEEKNELDASQKEKSEGGSLLQYSKDLVSSVMPGKSEENKETTTSPQEKGGHEGSVTQPQEKNEGSMFQYSKDLVSSVMPGKEKSEENKETVTSPQEKGGHEGSVTQPQEKNEGSLYQYSKDFVSSMMPGKDNSEENKETPTSPQGRGEENKETLISPRGKGEENKESVTQPQEKSQGYLQYSKDLVSSVMPGKEKDEKNKGTPTTPRERIVENKGADNNNNVAKVSTHGSSALGGITNPLNLLLGGDSSAKSDDADSPVHPSFKGEVDASHTIKPHNVVASQKGQKPSDVVLPNAVLPESRLLPKDDAHHSGSQQTFDLTGDYNKQKGKEQEQDRRDQKLSEKHHQKQEEVSPKDKYVSPHSPPLKAPVGNNNDRPGKVEVIPPKPSSAVHPDDLDVIPKVTKRDKVNATVGKAVGILKEKIGKLVKNDNLAARGAEKKADAKKTQELAEVQKRVDDI